MKLLLTPARIRAAIEGARTEKDIVQALRRHKIKYTFDTRAGFMAIRIPARAGAVLVYRTCSRSAPFAVRTAAPLDYPHTLPRFTWDD
jgi:hypothetical protein